MALLNTPSRLARTTLSIVALALGTLVSAHAETSVAVAPQYDTTHVDVVSDDVDAFVQSLVATFGGQSTWTRSSGRHARPAPTCR